MECDNCGEDEQLFVVAGEDEGFDRNIGWCRDCIEDEPRLELVPYSEEKQKELRPLMKHPAEWYDVAVKDESILKDLKE